MGSGTSGSLLRTPTPQPPLSSQAPGVSSPLPRPPRLCQAHSEGSPHSGSQLHACPQPEKPWRLFLWESGGWDREKHFFFFYREFFFSPFAYGGTDGPMIHKNCLQLNSHFAWLDLSVVWAMSAGLHTDGRGDGTWGRGRAASCKTARRPRNLLWAWGPSRWAVATAMPAPSLGIPQPSPGAGVWPGSWGGAWQGLPARQRLGQCWVPRLRG